MNAIWNPEHVVNPLVAKVLIRSQFPSLCPEVVELLGNDWDNTAFLVNERYVFRFPRRQIAVPFIQNEWTVLPKISPFLPLAIPKPEWLGTPSGEFPWPFIGYRLIEGQTACQIGLSDEERMAMAPLLGTFLSALHSVPPPKELTSGDNLHRIESDLLIPKISENLELLGIKLTFPKASYRKGEMRAVVHGDLYVRHLIVNSERALTAVIDWGDLHLGDPAIDIAIAHAFLPEKAHSAFRQAYGYISESTWDLAHLRALFSSSMIALYGRRIQDVHLEREGLRLLLPRGLKSS